ncbi:DUF1127 domain-containing protein [Roseococcus sp. SYP-B2431]|uniref:DUF1127 domain-containing protein n=1 Tax=Roseococcus sp. SYP-B2431 TaxID=2496640 RepID=UPI00103FE954|nr:DUF1127 domain-containing protein [Roseococcus sp. SYP-B2431]TCH98351.1 DUF1127 domain-containing protein [Roseococcus sp. SYP-B2431]
MENRPAPSGPGVAAGIRRIGRLAGAWARFVHRLRCHRQRLHLAEMDERMLRDIGASRSTVWHEQRKWWWQL